MKDRFAVIAALALTVMMSATLLPLAQAAPVSGAIFTTLNNGSVVNGNQYDSKCAVYLDGGPGPHAPAHAAGLPDADYYFQVTDPSGKFLLSTDIVSNRRFRVGGGVITAYLGSVTALAHPTGIDQDHGAVTIRLANNTCPTDFLDSPNNGGAYKVWATPVSDFVGNPEQVDSDCGNGCFHGFLPAKSKTDNFRKSGIATFCLTVVGASSFYVTDPLGVVNHYFTDATGTLVICGLGEGTYTVTDGSTTQTFTWTADMPPPTIVFEGQPG